jgi:phosphatidylserine/phosphatidylglycerophosphate/cardiolipin synthase-like enzyme
MRGSVSRDTAVALKELFASATERVLVAGFWFYNAADILEPLYRVMRDRSVETLMFLHIEPALPKSNIDAHVAEQVRRFLRFSWPFGAPYPALYYDPDTVFPGAGVILHAKCVVVDERRSLVTSANFTESAQTRNIEVGALIDDATFARNLVKQWRSAADAGFFRALEFRVR